ncbi:MAG: alpha/beta hydrolase [Thermoplasmata archaeon]|jgi:3-oxoadipate enol-lactonase
MASDKAPLPSIVRGNGNPVVFLHGYPLSHVTWKEQLGPLSASHKVVLLDFPGYGMALSQSVPTTLAGFSESVHTTLQALSLTPATIFGHSFGGYVALQLHRDHPDDFRGLGLVSTRSEADSPDARAKRLDTIERLRKPGETLDIEGTVRSLVSEGTARQQPAIVQVVREIVQSVPTHTIIPTLQAIADRPDLTPDLARIQVPTLVLWGENDGLIPKAQTQALVERIRGAHGSGFPDTGHLAFLESPGAFNRTVQVFLDAHP